jgi:2-keto-4-pentenoate hydratase/2-oxohepta-3-ene-1,7-dioic acid hydratase in catechol pathway
MLAVAASLLGLEVSVVVIAARHGIPVVRADAEVVVPGAGVSIDVSDRVIIDAARATGHQGHGCHRNKQAQTHVFSKD